MTDELVRTIGAEADEITGAAETVVDATVPDEDLVNDEDEEVLEAIRQALEFAGAAVDIGQVLQELGVETKGARTFANQIAQLAGLASNERSQKLISALAIVVAHSRPEEWPALADILSRSVPRKWQERAREIAERMREEAGIGYAKPGYPEYPEPQEKGTEAGTEQEQQPPVTAMGLKELRQRVDEIGGEIEELRRAITTLLDQVATLGAIVSRESKAMPVTRDVARSPVAALLVEQLTGRG